MTWIDTLFTYCERGSDPGLLAEPVNVLTNGAFFIAALMAWRHQRRQTSSARDVDHTIFIVLIGMMGIGSTAFHVFAQPWAFTLDVAPIAIFVLVYLNYALNRFLALTPGVSLLITLAYLAVIAGLSVLPGGLAQLNGSIIFVPALLALLVIGALLRRQTHPACGWLLAGAGVFFVSLVLRTVDKSICTYSVIAEHAVGTHGLWHIFNAILLYMLVRAAIDHGRHGEQTYEVIAPTGQHHTD